MTTSTRRLPSGDTITYDSEDGSRIWRRKDGTTWPCPTVRLLDAIEADLIGDTE